MPQPGELVDRIVRGVLDSLQPPAVAVRSPEAPERSHELRLTDAVVTGGLLEERWNQQSRVAIDVRSVLTPSAREFLKKRSVEVVRRSESSGASSSAVPSKGVARWRLFVVQSHPQLAPILEETNGKGAAWERMLPASLPESIAAAVGALLRAEVAGGLILTERPLAAACRANRHPGIRAAAIGDIASINAARRQLDPNLYCLDPGGKSYFELRNVVRAISSGASPKPPADWSE